MTRIEPQLLARLTPAQQGAAVALELHRRTPPRHWQAQIDALEHPEARAAASSYLEGIAARHRAILAIDPKAFAAEQVASSDKAPAKKKGRARR
jgi:hypothetical protein